jgi:hypothetical protein
MQKAAEVFVILTKNRAYCDSHYNIIEDEPNIIVETSSERR